MIYKIIERDNIDELCQRINEYLKLGAQLIGGVSVSNDYYHQALIIQDEGWTETIIKRDTMNLCKR